MNVISQIIVFAGFSGITILLGGILANGFEHHIRESSAKDTFVHTMIAFGGGIILSAVALVLIPRGMEKLPTFNLVTVFGCGAILFFFVDKYLEKKGGKTATLLAMLMDFIPEAIALGAVFANDRETAILLAVFIGLQNLPEAFNAFRDIVQSGFKVSTTLTIFFFLSFSGIICALLGHYLLEQLPNATAYIMIFSSGGILYLLFQDIAPDSRLKNSWLPSLGATLGFTIGIIGEKLI